MQVGRAEPKRPSRPDTLRPVLDSFEHFRSSARLYQSVFWSLLSCAPRRFQLCANSVFVSIPWHVSAHNHVLGPVKLTMWFDSQVSVTILLRLNFLLPRGPEPHLPPALTVVTAFSAGFQSPIAGGSLLHSWHVDLFWNNRSSVHWNGFMGGRPVELSGWVRWRRAASRATFRWPIVGISFSARGSEGGGVGASELAWDCVAQRLRNCLFGWWGLHIPPPKFFSEATSEIPCIGMLRPPLPWRSTNAKPPYARALAIAPSVPQSINNVVVM